MSSPQHPTGSGPHPWQDQPPQHPGQNAPQAGGQPPVYGSGPGPVASGPGQAYGSAPGPYGSAPGPYGSAPGQNAAAPGPYGSAPAPAPAQYGSGPGPYGSAPGPYGSGPGPYGSAPGQFGQAPAPKQKTGPGLIGPLTLRDLFLLFAGLLAFIALFVPNRSDFYFGYSHTLWHWHITTIGPLVFEVLAILLIVAAVLVNKLGNGRMRVGSLSLDQFISAVSAVAFAFAFVDLITSVMLWHVGAYLTFFAALIAFFAGVFTMIPFFAQEFAVREAIETHPKARPVSKHTPHPAPVANVPGGNAGGPGFAPYGSAPAGAGQPGLGQPGQGQPGPGHPGAAAFGAPGQPGQAGQPHQTGGDQFGQNQFAASGQPGQQPDQQQFGQPDQPRFGQPDEAQQPNPYAPPQQQDAERSGNAFAASPEHSNADGPVHSTGDGQTYLGRRDSHAPQHSQSEPTQTFGVGAGHDQSEARADQPTESGDETHSGAGAAAAGAGVIGAGAAAAGVAAAHSDSERRRGRHAAPDSDTAETNEAQGSAEPTATADSAPVSEDEAPTVVSPAESSDLVSKVNAKTSDTNVGTAEDAAIDGGDTGAKPVTDSSSDSASESPSGSAPQSGSAEQSDSPQESIEQPSPTSQSESASQPAGASASDAAEDNANIGVSEATAVNTPAGEDVVPAADGTATRSERTEAPESEEPTQYVPVASYRNRPEAENPANSGSDRTDDDTVAQTAIDNEPVPADAGQGGTHAGQGNDQGNEQDGGRTIVQAFWFAVPEPREAVDPTTGLPVFTIYPGDWYLSLEDNGSWFKVRDTDGSEGILRNIEGIQRG